MVSQDLINTYTKECRQLLQRLAGFPLAIHVAAHYLQRQSGLGHDMPLECEKLDKESELLKTRPIPQDKQLLLNDLEGNTSVLALLQLSTDALDVDVRERLAMIGSALLKNSAPTGLDFMKECWEVSSAEADRIADQLVEAGVLEPHATVGGVRYLRTHDIIRNHAMQLRQQMLNDGT